MDHVQYLRCLMCGVEYDPAKVEYVCPDHGDDGVLDVVYDYDLLRSRVSRSSVADGDGMWRFRQLLPVEPDTPVPLLPVGDTPLIPAPRLASSAGVAEVWIKDEGRQPTASLKDRASAMAVVKATERGTTTLVTASTGNAAAALAGLCASTGARAVIFVPAAAPQAKIAQLHAFGAAVVLVDGSYDQAVELAMSAAAQRGWYNRSTGFNPYMTEGKKTAVYEVCEALGWSAPDAITVGVGDGSIIGGLHKGLRDLLALGWIDRMPRLIGVQAEGSAYLADAWRRDEDVVTKPAIVAHTVADSIAAGLPRDRIKAMAAVRDTGGGFVTVSDDEILAAIPAMARGSGVFAEPAAAAAWAGVKAAVADNMVRPSDRV
ncbi:MAG TPA: threonine synthase, partial [Acidimicrobiia bacterium]|nr:threonine synthase [Acidimicrobiia bacterium]